jgi:hypothetical protein
LKERDFHGIGTGDGYLGEVFEVFKMLSRQGLDSHYIIIRKSPPFQICLPLSFTSHLKTSPHHPLPHNPLQPLIISHQSPSPLISPSVFLSQISSPALSAPPLRDRSSKMGFKSYQSTVTINLLTCHLRCAAKPCDDFKEQIFPVLWLAELPISTTFPLKKQTRP